MVQSGGKSTMLGHWRIVLRQAEEAARAGRYDEALALASRPDVADHHHAVQLRGRRAQDLIARAGRRGEARRDVEGRQKAAAPKVEALYVALEKGQWAEVLNAAESVLEAVPEHPAARQARTRAWQQIAAIGPSATTLPDRGSRVPQSA